MSTTQPLIQLENLSKVFFTEELETHALGGIDFELQKVAQRGNFSQCNATCVFPSPRPSATAA